MIRLLPAAVEPEVWQIAFQREAANRWAKLIPGKYKHVFAYAYFPGLDRWIIYDICFERTRFIMLPDGEATYRTIAVITENCDVLRMRRLPARKFQLRSGFFCTTAIKHLLGLRGGALRCDSLFRLCGRNGAEFVHGVRENQNAAAAIRPGAGARSAA